MGNLAATRVSHLILKVPGLKPTVPNPVTLKPGDTGWKATDLLPAEKAYNEVDDKWYYRSANVIKELVGGGSGQEVIIPIQNNTGQTLHTGKVVYPVGATGVGLANAHLKDKSRLIAVVKAEILDGQNGELVKIGEVSGFDTSGFQPGDIAYLSDTVDGGIRNTPPEDGSFIVIVGIIGVVSASSGSIYVDTRSSDLTVEVTDTNGFPTSQRAATALSYNNGTRTFTITPLSSLFHYYILGEKFEQSLAQSIQWDDLEGNHWIYFDKDGIQSIHEPTAAQKGDIILSYAFVSYFYWNAVDHEVVFDIFEERHGISMSPQTHAYLHITRGSQLVKDGGYAVGNIIPDANGSLATHAQFSVTPGTFYDEDLKHVSTQFNVGDTLEVAYLSGAALSRVDSQAGFAVLNAPAGRLYYNQLVATNWQLTQVGNNNYVLYHLFGINGVNKQLIAVMGQNQYGTISEARAGATSEITNIIGTFEAEEGVPIATIIFQTSDSYSNAVKARIRTTEDGDNFIDWRTSELAQGVPPSSHANLTNVEQAGPGVTYGHVNEALYNQIVTQTKDIALDDTDTGYKLLSGYGYKLNSADGAFSVLALDPGSDATCFITIENADNPITLDGDGETINGSATYVFNTTGIYKMYYSPNDGELKLIRLDGEIQSILKGYSTTIVINNLLEHSQTQTLTADTTVNFVAGTLTSYMIGRTYQVILVCDNNTLDFTTSGDFEDGTVNIIGVTGRVWLIFAVNPDLKLGVTRYSGSGGVVILAPTVTTQAVSDITATTAAGNGNITDLGGGTVSAHGFVWSTSQNPTLADTSVDNGATASTGAFTGSITGLTDGLTYYVRAFATNEAGTSYGDQVSFVAEAPSSEENIVWGQLTNAAIENTNDIRANADDGAGVGTSVFNMTAGNYIRFKLEDASQLEEQKAAFGLSEQSTPFTTWNPYINYAMYINASVVIAGFNNGTPVNFGVDATSVTDIRILVIDDAGTIKIKYQYSTNNDVSYTDIVTYTPGFTGNVYVHSQLEVSGRVVKQAKMLNL